MTIRSFATSAPVITLCLIGTALPGVSAEIDRNQTAPFMIAAVQNAAPDFAGISNWFNSAPLTMAKLRGKVVLVDFWTYGCVNCVNTLPHVTELYAKYKDRGLVVIGVHTPEFAFEKSASNVQAALSGMASAIRSRRTTSRGPGTPMATSTGRRSTSSIRAEKSCSSTPAKASMNKSIAPLRAC